MCEKIREYSEGLPVTIESNGGVIVIKALNEAGCNWTQVDLRDVLAWVKQHQPELLG